jgi:hypothetical protein
MTLDDKHNIIFETTNNYINEFERELSERINSTEFKMELKRRLEKQNVQIDFVNMNNTETFHNITIDKYSVFVCEDFYDDLNRDIVIH